MGGEIGIDLGPPRRPPLTIGVTPRCQDRLVIRKRPPLGCLGVAAAGLAVALVSVGRASTPWGPAVASLLCGLVLFGRAWLVIDRRRGRVHRGIGAVVPFWLSVKDLGRVSEVVVEKNEEAAGEAIRTTYPVSLGGGEKPMPIGRAGVWEEAVALAEVLAHFLRAALDDRAGGSRRRYEDLEIPVIRRSARELGLAATSSRSARRRPAEAARVRTFTEGRGRDGILRIHVPRPRDHTYLGLAVIVLVVWTLPVSLLGDLLFGLLPLAVVLGSWLKVAYGLAADLEVTPARLSVAAHGLIRSRRVEIPAAELEDLLVRSLERGGPREALWHAFPGVLVARSDRAAVRFGYGLSSEELERLRRLILEELRRRTDDSTTSQATPSGPFRLPTLYRPWAPAAGLLLGAGVAAALGGRLAEGFALPLLGHLLNAGGLLGLLAGVAFERLVLEPQRRLGRATWLGLAGVALAAAYAMTFPGAPGLDSTPGLGDDLALLGSPEARLDPLFVAGWLPIGVGLVAGALLLLGGAARIAARVPAVLRLGGRWVGRHWRAVAVGAAAVLAGVVLLQRQEIFWALAGGGHQRAVGVLLAVDPGLAGARDRAGRTALHRTARTPGAAGVVADLLAAGAGIETRDSSGQTPLHLACGTGDPASARLLLERGADADARDLHGRSPLMAAAWRGEIALAEVLLERGANVWARDAGGLTALHAAVNHPAMAELLLQRAAAVDARTAAGATPLMLAAARGAVDTVQLLLEHGAALDGRDANDATVLHHAADPSRSASPAALRLLLERGADAAARDRFGRTPLAVARERGRSELAAALEAWLGASASRRPGAVEAEPYPGGRSGQSVQGSQSPGLLVEAVPQPSELAVRRRERAGFTALRFGDGVVLGQHLGLAVDGATVWVGTERGLLRYRDGEARAALYGMATGIPGERIEHLVVAGGAVASSVALSTRPGYATGHGSFLFEPSIGGWRRLASPGDPTAWDGARLWLGDPGLHALDLLTGGETSWAAAPYRLLHDAVSAVVATPEEVWVAMRGDYVRSSREFRGGGVSWLELQSGRWKSFVEGDGLAASYCCALAVDDREVWVAHWKEELGLSVLDRRSGRWSRVGASREGSEVGGVCLALDGRWLWVGQQGALARLDRASHAATFWRESDGLPGYIVSGIAFGEDAVWVSLYAYDGGGGVRDAGLARFPR